MDESTPTNAPGTARIRCLQAVIPLGLALTFLAAACGSDTDESTPATTVATSPDVEPPTAGASYSTTTAETGSPMSDDTPITITIGTTVLEGRLRDNPTARDLIAQLPLELEFRDLNSVEKIARLPQALTREGVPEGDDPEPNDIGYYAPSGDLVFYDDDVGYWDGIVRLGAFTSDMDLIRNQAGTFTATIELAE